VISPAEGLAEFLLLVIKDHFTLPNSKSGRM